MNVNRPIGVARLRDHELRKGTTTEPNINTRKSGSVSRTGEKTSEQSNQLLQKVLSDSNSGRQYKRLARETIRKAGLKHWDRKLKPLHRYEPTTQTRSFCGHQQEVRLSERTFKCQKCGREIDRNVSSARNIPKVAIEEVKGERNLLKTLPVYSGEAMPVEWAVAHDEAGSPSL